MSNNCSTFEIVFFVSLVERGSFSRFTSRSNGVRPDDVSQRKLSKRFHPLLALQDDQVRSQVLIQFEVEQ